ncbi:MAG TPA: hypothetical protein VKI44_40875 [Acetobacteraceae bacterium]|nr:hypothetical protein [Acetobacteraceae bacterium]
MGRLPDKIDTGVLTPEVVHARVTGTTPILRALDEKAHRAMAAFSPHDPPSPPHAA